MLFNLRATSSIRYVHYDPQWDLYIRYLENGAFPDSSRFILNVINVSFWILYISLKLQPITSVTLYIRIRICWHLSLRKQSVMLRAPCRISQVGRFTETVVLDYILWWSIIAGVRVRCGAFTTMTVTSDPIRTSW